MELIDLLPDYYEQNVTMQTLQSALSWAVGQLESGLTDTIDQCFAVTAESLLSRWETFLGLEVDISKSPEYRRERIMAKLSGTGTTTKAMIMDTASRYSNGEVEVIEDNANSKFKIRFVGTIGIPGNLKDLEKTIEEIKPAHLAVEYEYIYNTHESLMPFTHAELAAYTHYQLRNEVLTGGN